MKTTPYMLAIIVSGAASAQSPPGPVGSAAVVPQSDAVQPATDASNGLTIPPATSPDKNCAEAIGSEPHGKSPKPESKGGTAAGGPPISQEAKQTGCMIELPEKDKADQKPNQPPK
jgi:hypothetical protein